MISDDISAWYGTEVSGMLISEEDAETAYKSAVRSINGRNYTLPAVPVILTAGSVIMIKKFGK